MNTEQTNQNNKTTREAIQVSANRHIDKGEWLPKYDPQSETTKNSCLWLGTISGHHKHANTLTYKALDNTKPLDNAKTSVSTLVTPWPNQYIKKTEISQVRAWQVVHRRCCTNCDYKTYPKTEAVDTQRHLRKTESANHLNMKRWPGIWQNANSVVSYSLRKAIKQAKCQYRDKVGSQLRYEMYVAGSTDLFPDKTKYLLCRLRK